MLKPTSEIVSADTLEGHALFRIKKGIFSKGSVAQKKAKKALGYFDLLADLDLLENLETTKTALNQKLGPSTDNCFVGFGMEPNGRRGFLNSTSTENSLNRALAPARSTTQAPSLNTISGMCLFGSGSDQALTDDGRLVSIVQIGSSEAAMVSGIENGCTIIDINADPKLSLYEREKTQRLAGFINSLSGPASDATSFLVTPRIQYFLYLAPLFNQGRITPEALTKWFDLVDQRERMVQDHFSKSINAETSLIANPLDSIEDKIRRTVERGDPMNLQATLEHLSAKSSIWGSLIAQESPKEWKKLINLSYVAAFLRQAELCSQPGKLLMHVDDQLERVILSESGRIRRRCRTTLKPTGPIIGLYLLQSLAQLGLEDSDLYARVPEPADFEALEAIPRPINSALLPEG